MTVEKVEGEYYTGQEVQWNLPKLRNFYFCPLKRDVVHSGACSTSITKDLSLELRTGLLYRKLVLNSRVSFQSNSTEFFHVVLALWNMLLWKKPRKYWKDQKMLSWMVVP